MRNLIVLSLISISVFARAEDLRTKYIEYKFSGPPSGYVKIPNIADYLIPALKNGKKGLSKVQTEIYENISDKRDGKISFYALKDGLLLSQLDPQLNDTYKTWARDRIHFVNPRKEEFNTPEEFKALYEKKFGNRGLIYNSEATTIKSILFSQKMQCHSGTVFFEILRVLAHVERFKGITSVVIFEPGHVLPGYLKEESDPGGPSRFHLYGVETTVAGQGLKDYGVLDELNRPARVMEAVDFDLMEIFKDQFGDSEKVAALYNYAFDRMQANYGYPKAQVEALIAALPRTSDGSGSGGSTNPAGFGEPNVPKGDRPRAFMDKVLSASTGGADLIPEPAQDIVKPDTPPQKLESREAVPLIFDNQDILRKDSVHPK